MQQIVEKNPLGGIGYFSYAYDFQGNEVFRRESIKPQGGSTEDVLTVLTTYDHAGRVVKEETTVSYTHLWLAADKRERRKEVVCVD